MIVIIIIDIIVAVVDEELLEAVAREDLYIYI